MAKIRRCKTVFFSEVFRQMVKSAVIVDLREEEERFHSFLMLAHVACTALLWARLERQLTPCLNQMFKLKITSRCLSEARCWITVWEIPALFYYSCQPDLFGDENERACQHKLLW